MKSTNLSKLGGGIAAAALLVFATAGPAAAEDDKAAMPGSAEAAPDTGLTQQLKEAGAHGVGTAADEAANGADMGTAASKGTSAAINKAMGSAAPAAGMGATPPPAE